MHTSIHNSCVKFAVITYYYNDAKMLYDSYRVVLIAMGNALFSAPLM